MRKIAATILTLVAFSLVAGQFAAAKPKRGNGNGGNLASAASSITLEQYSELRLGGTVGFVTDPQGLAGWEHPMVGVWCYQDRNGDSAVSVDGTNNADLVYAELRTAGVDLQLGGGGSIWLWNGGAAECLGVLYAYGWRGGQEYTRSLASVGFHAAG
jgi:hypothetical protein